jgi:hypothetical protein
MATSSILTRVQISYEFLCVVDREALLKNVGAEIWRMG